jgi:hypothetical protein
MGEGLKIEMALTPPLGKSENTAKVLYFTNPSAFSVACTAGLAAIRPIHS